MLKEKLNYQEPLEILEKILEENEEGMIIFEAINSALPKLPYEHLEALLGNIKSYVEEKINDIELEKVKEALENLYDSELKDIANDYFEANNYELIYENNEDEIIDYFNNDLQDYFNRLSNNYCKNDNYFRANGYGEIYSFDYISDEVDMDELAKYVFENLEKYQGILDL